MTLRRKVIPVEFQIKPFVRQMKSPRPPRMAGRRAAILLIRLVAPCARSAALSLLARHPLRVFGRSTLLATLGFLFLRLRHTFPVSAARSRARLLFPSPRRVMRRSSSFSCGVSRRRRSSPVLRPPRGVGGAPRGALRNRSRLRSATTVLARHGAVPATGTAPVGAPPWRFTDRATTRHVSDSASDHAAPSRGRPHGQPFGSRGLPAAVAPRFRDATPRSASERLRRRPSRARMGADIAWTHYVVKFVFMSSHEVVM
jgi:hypothetical protein